MVSGVILKVLANNVDHPAYVTVDKGKKSNLVRVYVHTDGSRSTTV